MTSRIPVTIVNHVAIDIAASPDAVWAAILEEYVEAKKFRTLGTITPLDDPSAPFGGYHMRLEHEGGFIDERIVQFTERDEDARRLSAFANYLSVPGGMKVYATYHAQETPGGARFAIDCHAGIEIDVPAGATRAEVEAIVAQNSAAYDAGLIGYLESVKVRLESAN